MLKKELKEIVSRLERGDIEELEMVNHAISKLDPQSTLELTILLLDSGKAEPIFKENRLNFVPIQEVNDQEAFCQLIDLCEKSEISADAVKKFMTTDWVKSFSIRPCSEKATWLNAFYNIRNKYVTLFLESLEKDTTYTNWREIPIPQNQKKEQASISLKEALLTLLKFWPTRGKSGCIYLQKLRSLDKVQQFNEDNDILTSLNNAESRCDYGYVNKAMTLFDEG